MQKEGSQKANEWSTSGIDIKLENEQTTKKVNGWASSRNDEEINLRKTRGRREVLWKSQLINGDTEGINSWNKRKRW